ncbi:HAMP domain-containing methyl-accepting chemotaxis protein [Sphingomonas swuensis]|uniref:HAMP domain-containing methyl-accepting chemotaxis protein n=2 Tax=Sphingomonas swuensis TaxID=977800 RepID=A0ABP7SCV1_9SPHN
MTDRVRWLMLGLLLLCGGLGIGATMLLRWSSSAQEQATTLLRHQMTADMMHDAIRGDVLAILASRDPMLAIDGEGARSSLDERITEFRASMAKTRAFRDSPSVSAAAAAVQEPFEAYNQAAVEIAGRAIVDPAGAARLLPGFFERFEQLEVGMEKLTEAIEQHGASTSRWARLLGLFAIGIISVALLGALVVAVRVALAMRRQLIEPLIATSAAIERLAAGDRTQQVEGTNRPDELGTLARGVEQLRTRLDDAEKQAAAQTELIVGSIGEGLEALARSDLSRRVEVRSGDALAALTVNFNRALDSLCGVVRQVADSASTLRGGAGEIASATQDFARRTEHCAASIEQTSHALVEVDNRIRGAAETAASTVAQANQGIAVVERGRATTDEAVAAMERVSDSATGIDSVIEGLDKIAFQTRVLAMNAAVEAGHAGEAGKGFAVVADLVSALAMRAEEEAKRARHQLTVTQGEIAGAVTAVRSVDGALNEIAGSVSGVHQLIATIAADNQAQAGSMSQIREAMAALDRATQQNAAMVEESSAATQELAQQADRLTREAARFVLPEAGAAPRAGPALVARAA